MDNTCKRAYSYYTMFRHSINKPINGILCYTVTSQERKETRKPVNTSRNQSKNVAVYSMIENIHSHLPPMYSPTETHPHITTYTNLSYCLFYTMLAQIQVCKSL